MKNNITPSSLVWLLNEENINKIYFYLKWTSLESDVNSDLQIVIRKTKALCRLLSIDFNEVENPKELIVSLEKVLKKVDSFESQWLSDTISKIRKQTLGLVDSEKKQEFEKLKLEHTLHLRALDNSAIVQEISPEGFVIYANKKTEEISGRDLKDIIWQHTRVMNSKYHTPDFWINLWKTVKSWNVWNGEIRNKRESWGYYWTNTTITPFLEDWKVVKFIVIRFDTTELHEQRLKLDNLSQELERKNKLLETLSLTDWLTGLWNRRSFDSTVEKLVESKSPCVIWLFDIDFFKRLNDEFWHQEGDKVLINIGKFCLDFSNLYSNFKVFRYGWEEFSIIIEGENQEYLIKKFFDFFKQANLFEKKEITISLGYEDFKDWLKDYKASLEWPDKSLYEVKNSWRNNYKKS